MKPAESRHHARERYYLGDMPEVIIDFLDGSSPFLGYLHDFSAEGIGLCHERFKADHVGKEISITLGTQTKYSVAGIIQNHKEVPFGGSRINRVSVKFEGSNSATPLKRPRRFKCPTEFSAVAWGDHPFRYNHKLFYTVHDFSANGVTLKGQGPKNLLIPGVKLLLHFMLPATGQFEVLVETTSIRTIRHQDQTDSQNYYVGCTFVKPSRDFLVAVSSYLMLDTTISIDITSLKENGFLLPELSPVLQFSYVNNDQEWNEVLKLRLRAAQKAGRWIGETDHNKLQDEYDQFARHVICKLHNKIVGAGRIVFNNKDKHRVEHHKYMEIPRKIWDAGFIETSRVCTDPDYRGASIFVGFLHHGARVAVQAGIPYVIMNCEDSLVPIYCRYGASEMGIQFYTPFMKDKRLNILVCKPSDFLGGKDVGPLYWYVAWRDLRNHLEKNGFLKLTITSKIRTVLYLLIGMAFSPFLAELQIRKEFRKRESALFLVTNSETSPK